MPRGLYHFDTYKFDSGVAGKSKSRSASAVEILSYGDDK